MNWVGTRTLVQREVSRFLEAPIQTIAAPLTTGAIYFLVFGFTGDHPQVSGVTYSHFIVPGLIFLGSVNTAFMNTSTSLLFARTQRTIEDLVMAPLSPGELLFGFLAGGLVRGVTVAVLSWLFPLAFLRVLPDHPLVLVAYAGLSIYLGALLGIVVGLWVDKFERIGIIPQFVITPLAFFGGIFHSIDSMQEPFRTVSELNPLAHLIDGMRYGMSGSGSRTVLVALAPWAFISVVLTWVVYAVIKRGWKLRH